MKLIVKLFSSLPIIFLKQFRRFIYFLLCYIVCYRKEVIQENLSKSFPTKSKAEINQLYRKFTFHFSEFLLEYLVLFKGSKSFYEDNVQVEGWKDVQETVESGQHVIIAMGHQGSWEYAAVRLSQLFSIKMTGIYKKIKNPKTDKIVFDARSKFGLHLFEIKDSVKQMLRMRKEPAAHLFIMDQSPRKSQSKRWIKFLNQDTLILEGVEKMSKALNAKVFWLSVEKEDFAKYKMILKELESTNIMKACYDHLESDIQHQPETWLWSHRRWKIKKVGAC